MKPPANELERRRPVWDAMSAVFLDTEIDDACLRQIVDTLAASGYSEAELDRIFWDEVCPQLHRNLLCVAGEWDKFDMELVEFGIVRRTPTRFRRWPSRMQGGRIARHAWLRIKQALADRRET